MSKYHMIVTIERTIEIIVPAESRDSAFEEANDNWDSYNPITKTTYVKEIESLGKVDE